MTTPQPPKIDDPGTGHVTYVYYNADSGKVIPYVMNDVAASEVNSIAHHILLTLDDLRAGKGDPLAGIEALANSLLQIAGPV